MIKSRHSILAVALPILLFFSQAPSQSSDSSSPLTAGPVPGAGNNTAPSHRANVPKKLLGIIAGVVVGTPVCAVRKSIEEEKHGISDMCGYNHKARVVIPAALFMAPFGLVTGVLEAPFHALNNSLVNHAQPFSKEQFSLGEED